MDKPKKNKIWKLLPLIVIFLVITLAAIPLMQYMTRPEFITALEQWVEQAGIWGIAVLLLVQMAQIVVAFIPGEPIEVAAGAMYGMVGGLAICLAGILVSSSAIFWIVRRLGRERLSRTRFYPKLMAYDFLRNEDKLQAMVFLLYLIPGTPKDILVYVCALTGISMRSFLTISTVARIPSVITSTMAGATFASGNHLLTIAIFAVTGVAGLVGIYYHNKRFASKQRED